MSTLYRQEFGPAAPALVIPVPAPTIDRIPKTMDGCTWYAHAEHNGETIGATARTKRDAVSNFSDQWARFAR